MAGADRNRAARVAEAIKIELAELVAREVKDPRVRDGLVTVSHVEVNRDLSVADVGVSILAAHPGPVMKGLQAAAGFLRGPLARRLRLRVAPELRFHHDTSQEMATRLRDIVREDDARRVNVEGDADEAGAGVRGDAGSADAGASADADDEAGAGGEAARAGRGVGSDDPDVADAGVLGRPRREGRDD